MRLLVLLIALTGPVHPARAGNGTWLQFDAWNGGAQLAVNVERGRIVWGMAAGDDDGEPWARASALYTWETGPDRAPWKLRAGPALKAEKIGWWEVEDHQWARCIELDRCGALRLGLRLSVEQWAEYGDWGTFLMADYIGIDDAKSAVAGLTHLPSGWGGQLLVWDESGDDATPTVMLSKRLTRRLSLRLGRRFDADGDETFLGVSFSTY